VHPDVRNSSQDLSSVVTAIIVPMVNRKYTMVTRWYRNARSASLRAKRETATMAPVPMIDSIPSSERRAIAKPRLVRPVGVYVNWVMAGLIAQLTPASAGQISQTDARARNSNLLGRNFIVFPLRTLGLSLFRPRPRGTR
jgi:hypothetical protein